MSSANNNSTMTTTSEEEEASLPKLLSALALGARSVHGLPLGDEYAFQSSFPEFASAQKANQQLLLDTLQMTLQHASLVETGDLLDPTLWQTCADACDALVNQVEAYLETSSKATLPLEQWSSRAHLQARNSLKQVISSLVEMEKPQVTFGIIPQNDRTSPFVPCVKVKHHAQTPLSLEWVEGHGLDSRYGALPKRVTLPKNVVTPTHHVPHVYQKELESLEYPPWQLKEPTTKPPPIQKDAAPLKATWVDTIEQLDQLAQDLEQVRLVAVDLEAHAYRSFAGMTCLMQLSFLSKAQQKQNYLVDTLVLWHDVSKHLAPMFCNPQICKIMHGADYDVQWLQRDFGIYVVNLFDTGRAARALGLSSAGYAFLLQTYVQVETNKKYQLSDWRQRPLPDNERQYAIMDTHYLLDIYEHLRYDLTMHSNTSIKDVLDVSRQVCLIRHDKEPFSPMGYKSLLDKKKHKKKTTKTDLSLPQERVLARLYDWRDGMARQLDESVAYVCNNQGLVRLACACPQSVTLLQACMNPIPPVVMQYSQDVLDRIKAAMEEEEESLTREDSTGRSLASAYFQPAKADNATEEEEVQRATGILSPVLGTEALYKQAGWMTPQQGVATEQQAVQPSKESADAAATTTDDDLDPTTSKPRHLLMVHSENKDYRSANNYTLHSLEMASSGKQGSVVVDGLGSARAAMDQQEVEPHLKEESKQAEANAARIRRDMREKKDLLGVTTSVPDVSPQEEEEEETIKEPEQAAAAGGDSDNDDFEIPKSMREIYKISNRNRRKNKKSSPPPQASNNNSSTVVHLHNPKKVDTLEGTQAVLATAGLDGKGYFGSSDSKRQRTKPDDLEDSSGDGTSTKASNDKSRTEDDIRFMQEIGWIDNRQEGEELMMERRQSSNDGDDGTKDKGGEDRQAQAAPKESSGKQQAGAVPLAQQTPFDYSSVGQIGVFHPNAPPANNPFFAGAAVAGGGPLTLPGGRGSSQGKKKKDKAPRGGLKQEVPESKDGRSVIYKKR